MSLIGSSISRREGRAKVTGRAQYVDDLVLPGMLFGATVRSAAPRGIIKQIEFGPDIPWSDFVVVTARTSPAPIASPSSSTISRAWRPTASIILKSRSCFSRTPIVTLLEEARRHVRIDLDPEPAVFTMDEALDRRAIVWGSDNIFKNYQVERGDVDAAFAVAPRSSSKANTRPARRSSSTSRTTA